MAALLAGCGSTPRSGRYYQDDGPGKLPPSAVDDVPDAEPRIEPLARGPNRPYNVFGKDYVPFTADQPFRQRGLASWYGRKFHGQKTANGETYDMYAMTAAHPTMPLPSYARVTHLASGRQVIVRVNDRGPFHAGRVIDLSYAAAAKLGYVNQGSAMVEVERITSKEIRAGNWRRDATPPAQVEPEVALAQSPPVASPPVPPTGLQASGAAATTVTAGAATASAAATAADAGGFVVEASASAATAAIPEASPRRAPHVAAKGFWVQLGAFSARDGAEGFQRRIASDIDWLAPWLRIFDEAALFRLQAGPYSSRDEALGTAQRVREALQLVPMIVERR